MKGPIPSDSYESSLSTNNEASGSAASPTGNCPEDTIPKRGFKVTRTFEILNMKKPGDNPWGLGSAIANEETGWVTPEVATYACPDCGH